jgi:hypothetical protein
VQALAIIRLAELLIESEEVVRQLTSFLAPRAEKFQRDAAYEFTCSALDENGERGRGEQVQWRIHNQVVLQRKMLVHYAVVVSSRLPQLVLQHVLVGRGQDSEPARREFHEQTLLL